MTAGDDQDLAAVLRGCFRAALEHDDWDDASDFFAVGGSSLRAVRVLSCLRSATGRDVSAREFYTNASVTALLLVVAKASPAEQRATELPEGPSVIANQMNRLRTLRRHEASGVAQRPYNTTIYFRLRGDLDFSAVQRTAQWIVDCHESLRSSFSLVGEEASVVVAENAPLLVTFVDLASLADDERVRKAELQVEDCFNQRFSLNNPPLLRVDVVRLHSQEHLLCICMDHAVSDLESQRIFWEDFRYGYQLCLDGVILPLRTRSQYPDSAARLARLRATRTDRARYWRDALAGYELAPQYDLPFLAETYLSRPGPLDQAEVRLDARQLRQLRRIAGDFRLSTEVVALAVCFVALYLATEQPDALLYRANNMRDSASSMVTIGWYSEIDVLRFDIRNPDHPEGPLLEAVQSLLLDAVDNQLPFFEAWPQVLETDPRAYFGYWRDETQTWDLSLGADVAVQLEGEGTPFGFAGPAMFAIEGQNDLRLVCNLVRGRYADDALRRFVVGVNAALEALLDNPRLSTDDLATLLAGSKRTTE